MILAGEGNAHLLQSVSRLPGMGQPDIRCGSFAIESRCFDGPHRHRSAEHDDSFDFSKWVLDYQPATDTQENQQAEEKATGPNSTRNAQCTRTPRNRNGIV